MDDLVEISQVGVATLQLPCNCGIFNGGATVAVTGNWSRYADIALCVQTGPGARTNKATPKQLGSFLLTRYRYFEGIVQPMRNGQRRLLQRYLQIHPHSEKDVPVKYVEFNETLYYLLRFLVRKLL